jgi:Outer membrane protein beta-barrel domain
MNLRKLVCSATVLLASSLVCLSALADSGVYVGGGIGMAEMNDSIGNPGGADFKEQDTAWKGFVGYHLDVIPLVKFAAEVGYRDLGSPDGSFNGVPVSYKAHGLDYAVLAGLGLGPVDLMARFGGMNYKLEKNVGGVNNSYDGTAPVYGVGLWFTLFGVGVRAEYELMDIDELDDAQMVTVSAFYKF